MDTSKLRKRMPVSTLLDAKIVLPAVGQAFVKLNPRTLAKNPVMFVLEMVTLLTTILLARDIVVGAAHLGFELQIVVWLWFTVLFANFAEAVAEGRGKAQADALRRTRTETVELNTLTAPNRPVASASNVQAGSGTPAQMPTLGGVAVNPRGASGGMSLALATRDLMQSLREAGTITGGPKPFSRADRSAFLSALDRAVNRILRERPKPV